MRTVLGRYCSLLNVPSAVFGEPARTIVKILGFLKVQKDGSPKQDIAHIGGRHESQYSLGPLQNLAHSLCVKKYAQCVALTIEICIYMHINGQWTLRIHHAMAKKVTLMP